MLKTVKIIPYFCGFVYFEQFQPFFCNKFKSNFYLKYYNNSKTMNSSTINTLLYRFKHGHAKYLCSSGVRSVTVGRSIVFRLVCNHWFLENGVAYSGDYVVETMPLNLALYRKVRQQYGSSFRFLPSPMTSQLLRQSN